MTNDDKPKTPRLPRAGQRKQGFDLGDTTAPTNDATAGAAPATPAQPQPAPAPPVVATPQPADGPRGLARTDIPGAAAGAVPPPAPGPAAAAAGPGLAVSLGALVTPVNPETDLVQVNIQVPRYLAAALDMCATTRYGGIRVKSEHARRALGAYVPGAFQGEAYRALYPQLAAQNEPPTH